MITRRRILSTGMGLTALAASGAYLLPARSVSAQTQSFDFYISPSGSDSNPGTLAQPWSLRALDQRVADSYGRNLHGKRVGALDGMYRCGEMAKNGASNVVLPWTNFTLEAVNARQAVFTTENTNGTWAPWTWPGGILHIAGVGQVVRGINFNRCSHVAVWVAESSALIEECLFENFIFQASNPSNPGAIRTDNHKSGLTIRSCRFKTMYEAPAYGGRRIVAIGPIYNYTNITVEYCSFQDADGAFYPKRNCGNYTFRYNYCRDINTISLTGELSDHQRLTDSAGVFFADYGRRKNIWVHNIFDGCGRLSNGAAQAGQWAESMDFYHNTIIQRTGIVDNEGFIRMDNGQVDANGVAPPNPLPVTFNWYNNIFYTLAPITAGGWLYLRQTAAGDPYGFTHRANIWDYNGYNLCVYRYYTETPNSPNAGWWKTLSEFQNWSAAKGVPLDANSVRSDSHGFVNLNGASPADYRLTDASAFRSRGRMGGLASGAPTDMGAWGGGATQVGAFFGPRPQPPMISVG